MNKGIGGDTISIWVKYEDIDPSSETPVLTDVSVEHWVNWQPSCPPGFVQARGNSPDGALTTNTIGACWRMGLCVKMEPMREATPMVSLGLSYHTSGSQYSCPG